MSGSGGREYLIALVGNPNVGKTTLFNALTGLRHTTANYPGVTVEKRVGELNLEGYSKPVQVLDLPGTYSLLPHSPDEAIVRQVLLGHQKGMKRPDLAVVILDAGNFERNLYLALQVMDTGTPSIFVLNMWDEALEKGRAPDADRLSALLGIPCVRMSAHKGSGVEELRGLLRAELAKLPERREAEPLDDRVFRAYSIDERYKQIESVARRVMNAEVQERITRSDRIDAVVTHPVWGWVIFAVCMTVVFQSIFSWAEPFMNGIASLVRYLGQWSERLLPHGPLQSLVTDGIIAGVGNVVVFLPQIFLLFFFIAVFEDFGYMARAAFVLDRIMRKVGLNGRAFLPLLSSFACAIPGIMATRTIPDPKDRLVTILSAPFMSCSARLPVYTLFIAAFVPPLPVLGVLNLQGITLLGLYLLSVAAGLGTAALLKRTVIRGQRTPFLMELPPYRIPNLRSVLITTWDRGRAFLANAGGMIFWISILLWFLVSYPHSSALESKYAALKADISSSVSFTPDEKSLKAAAVDHEFAGERLKESYAGRLGRGLEPVIAPLGFDWRIGIGLIGSFAAREVLVSTLAIIHQVGEGADEHSADLISALRSQVDPQTGKTSYTLLTALSLMVFFVLACQCMSTLAVVRRETNSLRWPIFMFVYMTLLAWMGSFVVYQSGRFLGFQ